MITKDDILFEEDPYDHVHIHTQEEVKEALVNLINDFIIKLDIKRLDKVVVKKIDFSDTKLGIADYKNFTIVLANKIAFCLVDKDARFYQRSLAVLKHELYHFQDFQNLLNCIPQINDEILGGFHYWSEFFATHSTFDLCQDENIYSSFKYIYEKSYSTMDEKKYHACQLMGYYMHANHNSVCDELVHNYLSTKHIKQTVEAFDSILETYPCLSIEQLRNVGIMLDELVVKKVEPPILTPVYREDFLSILRRKSSNN